MVRARLTHAALLTASQLACGGSLPSAYDRFVVPPEEFLEATETIALAPLDAAIDLGVPPCMDAVVDSALTAELKAVGFQLIPSFVQDEIWTRITEEAGGFFDPYTGARDEERFAVAAERFREELRAKYAPDAILYPQAWVVEARVNYGKATWDQVTESVPVQLGTAALALSLIVVIEDLDAMPLYVNGGGVRVLERWDRASREVTRVPAEELCTERERIAEAVAVALGPLTEERARRQRPAR